MRAWWRQLKIKIGLKLLRFSNLVVEDLLWFLSNHKEFRIPVGSNIHSVALTNLSIVSHTVDLLQHQCIIISYKAYTDVSNGDKVINIAYMDKHAFANLLLWAKGNLLSMKAPDIEEFIDGNSEKPTSI